MKLLETLSINVKFQDLSVRKTLVYNPHPLHIVTMVFLETPAASVRETNTLGIRSRDRCRLAR